MAGRKTGLAVVALAALALLAPSASAGPPWAADLAAISKGLDRAVSLGRLQDDEADALAQALIDRAVPRAGGLAWEYYFRFEGGRPPWISGMAQAVAAQALSRAGTRMEMPDLVAAARRAYATVPGLTLRVSTGP